MRNSVRIAWKCKEEPGLSFRAIRFSWNPPSIGNKLKGSFFPRFRVFLIIIITPHASTVTPLDADRGDPFKAAPLVKSKRKLLSNKGQLSRIALLVTSPSHSSQARKGILTFFTFEGFEFSFIFKQLSSLLVPPHNKSFAILY